MSGNSPMLTSKLHLMKSTVVDESLSSFKPMYCSREYQASTRSKLQHFVKYLGIMLLGFYEISITGILLMRLSKISCIWKTFCIILCFLHLIFTHTYIHICIHVCMLMCLKTIFFVPNAVLKSMCMLYLNPCVCYIDSLCN